MQANDLLDKFPDVDSDIKENCTHGNLNKNYFYFFGAWLCGHYELLLPSATVGFWK